MASLVLIPSGDRRLGCGAALSEVEKNNANKKSTLVGVSDLWVKIMMKYFLALNIK
jgi:hypothetical protein